MFFTSQYKNFNDRICNSVPVLDETSHKPQEKGLKNIVTGMCENAPYLKQLCETWPDILRDLATKSPESIYQNILANIQSDDLSVLSASPLNASLRQAKQRMHLLCACCDIAGVWDWDVVTGVLSDFADFSMQALIQSVADEMGFEGDEYGPVPGLFVLALGKYGGRELNYSSDIDLIVFYDPDFIKLPDMNKAERLLVRFVRKLMRGFDEMTPDGYIFRTDLRLRPDPRANSVAVSTLTAERYYETLGQNWERAAMIKARFCGGDKRAADVFFKTVLQPFIWRRSLDYAAVADIHSIKRQIQGNASIADMCMAGHDIKLGLGGIREIEFYTQVQQLILGGRNKALRTPRTVDALQALADGDYASTEIVLSMQKDYAYLRGLEHRTQMYGDAQTHNWPKDNIIRKQLAALCSAKNLIDFETKMACRFARVHQHYTDLFPDEEDLSSALGSLVFTGVELEATTLTTLQAYGFERGNDVWNTMADWLGGRIRATRTQRARELLTRLAPRIIEACGDTGQPDTAFFNFSNFMINLNAGVSLLSLLLNKPETLLSLINMLAIAPRLAKTLSTQPALIDAMVEPEFLTQKLEIPIDHYARYLTPETDFETAMNIVRQMVHEDQFSLTASILRQQNIEKVGVAFSAIAQAAIQALLPKAVQDVENSAGAMRGEYVVLAMGKLGGREMTLRSDVDVIIIYQPSIDDIGDAAKKFNKMTRRFITSLSSVTQEGALYEVDMALRPSGRSGPLAVTLEAFRNYYVDKAWTWEFMALSRARVIASSSKKFQTLIEHVVENALADKNYHGELVIDILDMHKRLATDKPAKGLWDIKGVLGGLRDIEFIAQFLILKNKPVNAPRGLIDILVLARTEKWLKADDANNLIEVSRAYQILLQTIAIAIDGIFIPSEAPISVKRLLVKSVGMYEFHELETRYEKWRNDTARIFNQILS
ncbi:MAG: bifunctional [glutamate--ammonia ligase]-adenylyl-L-tyrosine phosphorylase/[glutamate--ammonia-ligase] adenylyltransferase [Robiginitomaculum sp.]|nr:MAG: bifunctional [glutamate--ammonia ligase]-adenylyl-L-tyrosine phosphorylase/[glutamate--ammonia-ligase] adenylyltransferase [Robiginitomaculum sp.]